jgi:hypothetical protein
MIFFITVEGGMDFLLCKICEKKLTCLCLWQDSLSYKQKNLTNLRQNCKENPKSELMVTRSSDSMGFSM